MKKSKEKTKRRPKSKKVKSLSLFRKEDYVKDDVIEKKLVFKKTYVDPDCDRPKHWFIFTEPGKKKEIRIHKHTRIIEEGPHFKGNGVFTIGYDYCGTAHYIIKGKEVWYKFMGCQILHEENGKLTNELTPLLSLMIDRRNKAAENPPKDLWFM